jgi:hypothetical protein
MPAPVVSKRPSFPLVRYPPGLEATNDLHVAYRTPFFGADREYADNEGWTTVHYRTKSKRKQRRWRDVETENN